MIGQKKNWLVSPSAILLTIGKRRLMADIRSVAQPLFVIVMSFINAAHYNHHSGFRATDRVLGKISAINSIRNKGCRERER